MKKIFSLIIITIAIIISFICYGKKDTYSNVENLISEEKTANNFDTTITRTKMHDLGEVETIIEYGDLSLIAAHYPIFYIDKIDNTIKNTVQKYIDNFNQEVNKNNCDNSQSKSELNIDFDMYITSGDIVSLKFLIMDGMNYYSHPNISIKTFVIDLNKKIFITLDDIFEGKYLAKFSKTLIETLSSNKNYRNYIKASIFQDNFNIAVNNFNSFIIKENSIQFFFENYNMFSRPIGEQNIEIPFNELKDYLRNDKIKTNEELIQSSDEPIIENNKVLESSNEPAKPVIGKVRVIDPNKPIVALTFDDGPNKKTTVPIMDTLKKYNSAGTFFVLGNRVSYNKEILKRMSSEGNEIGNHTYNHKNLTTLTEEDVNWQLKTTQDIIFDTIETKPKIMRPTYGSYDENLKSILDMPMILWSIDTLDWKNRDANKVVNNILDKVVDGDIILMHDIYASTAEAVEIIVPELIDMGFQLVTVSELYEIRNRTLEFGKVYNHVHVK